MQTTLINHPKLHVAKRTGAEGPRHDPYHYDEVTIKTPDHQITLHEGLAVWMEIDGKRTDAVGEDYSKSRRWFNSHLLILIGYKLQEIERISRKAKERCPKGGLHIENWVEGFPGESMAFCTKCGRYVDGYFNEGAII